MTHLWLITHQLRTTDVEFKHRWFPSYSLDQRYFTQACTDKAHLPLNALHTPEEAENCRLHCTRAGCSPAAADVHMISTQGVPSTGRGPVQGSRSGHPLLDSGGGGGGFLVPLSPFTIAFLMRTCIALRMCHLSWGPKKANYIQGFCSIPAA